MLLLPLPVQSTTQREKTDTAKEKCLPLRQLNYKIKIKNYDKRTPQTVEKVKEKKNENTKKSNDPQQDKHIPVPLKEKTIFPPLVQLFNQSTNRIACLTAFEGGGKTQVFFSYPPFSSRDTSCFVVHLRFSRLHFRSMPPHFFFSFLIFFSRFPLFGTSRRLCSSSRSRFFFLIFLCFTQGIPFPSTARRLAW